MTTFEALQGEEKHVIDGMIHVDFAKVDPISRPPINPGPHVAENKSISFNLTLDSLTASFVICCSISR